MSAAWSTARAVVSRLVRPLLLVAIPALAVLIGLYVYARGGREVETENAYVKANVVVVSSEVSGRVAEVNVHDNEPVTVGAPLFRLDPTPFELAVAKASASCGWCAMSRQSSCPAYPLAPSTPTLILFTPNA